MCPNSSLESSKRGLMKLNLYKLVIDDISDYAYDINIHHRGESLIHPDLFEMIKYAKQKGLLIKLHTNATLLTEEKSYELLKSGLDLLSFSFEGYNKEIYEKIRVNANFDKTLNNIIRFLQIKKLMRKTKPYTIIEILKIPGLGEVEPAVEKLKERLRSLPLDEFCVKPTHNWAGNISFGEDKNNISKINRPCTFPWYSLTILWDGTVVPCPQDFFGEIQLGNINDSSLSEIWNNNRMVYLREKMIAGEYDVLKPCNSCDRLFRKTIFRSFIPKENVITFICENLLGYSYKKILTRAKRGLT